MKDYPMWEWVTSDRVLAIGPCELLFAHLVVSAASTDTHLYDGKSTAGKKIVTLISQSVTGMTLKPPEAIKCEQGLYVDVGTNVTGVLVQWRPLRTAEGD